MLNRLKQAGPGARLRLIVAFSLIGIAGAWGYVDRNPQVSGTNTPTRIVTSSERAADCGRMSVFVSGNGCGVWSVKKVTFLSANK